MHKAIAGIVGVAVIAAAVSKITHTGETTLQNETVAVAALDPTETTASGEIVQDDGVPTDVEATNFKPPRKPRASGAAVEPKVPTLAEPKPSAELMNQIRSERIRDAIKENQKKMDGMVKPDDATTKPDKKNDETQPMTDVPVEATPQQSRMDPAARQPQSTVTQPGTSDQIFTEFDTRYENVVGGQAYYFVPGSQQPVVYETIGQGSYSTTAPSCGSKGCCLSSRLSHLSASQLWEGYTPERRDW